jgi:glucose-6-phosphate isomerase
MEYTSNFDSSVSNEILFDTLKKERKEIGYYELVHQDVNEYIDYAKSVKQQNIVIVGIGGSSLGTYAIYQFLKDVKESTKKQLIFLETTDPLDVKSKLGAIDISDTLFIIISKSGSTVETVSLFKYLHTLVAFDSNNLLIITDKGSPLESYAAYHQIKSFEIPQNVGGRFSVFSAVGLVPLAIVGMDIKALLAGAREIYDDFFEKEKYIELFNKARFYTEYKYKYNINVVFSYTSRLKGFNQWYVQLWGESLGKIDKENSPQGLTPVGLVGPVDQHSFLQLIVEGKKDKTVTFITIKDFKETVQIPDITLHGLESMDYLNGIDFADLINYQAESTITVVTDIKEIPCDVVRIQSIDESSIAKLMYSYELLTSTCAQLLKIDAYDQPGVEKGKVLLKKALIQKQKEGV